MLRDKVRLWIITFQWGQPVPNRLESAQSEKASRSASILIRLDVRQWPDGLAVAIRNRTGGGLTMSSMVQKKSDTANSFERKWDGAKQIALRTLRYVRMGQGRDLANGRCPRVRLTRSEVYGAWRRNLPSACETRSCRWNSQFSPTRQIEGRNPRPLFRSIARGSRAFY